MLFVSDINGQFLQTGPTALDNDHGQPSSYIRTIYRTLNPITVASLDSGCRTMRWASHTVRSYTPPHLPANYHTHVKTGRSQSHMNLGVRDRQHVLLARRCPVQRWAHRSGSE